MRALGLVGLVLALAIVGLVVKKQMTAMAVVPAAPVAGDASASEPASAPVSQREQARQVQQQVKDALDAAAKTRQMPDDN